MSALAVLGSDLRTQEVEGQPWFHAGDACRLLGLNRGTEEVMLLGEDERKVIDGQLHVPESGLYKLMLRSNLPSARRFQDWVARDVLRGIRQDGGYVLSGPKGTRNTPAGLILRALKMLQDQQAPEPVHEPGAPLSFTNVRPRRVLRAIGIA